MINFLEIIFWLIMIVNAILILVYALDNVAFSYIFKKKLNLRLKRIENKVYKEDK